MLGFGRKKEAKGPMVWMIQKKGSSPALYLGVCKKDLVTLSNWQGCFRYFDHDSAGLMLYWMIQAGKVNPGDYEIVPVVIQAERKVK